MVQEFVYSGGGGSPAYLEPTVSSNSFSESWDYDADSILMTYSGNGAKHIALFIHGSSSMYFANVSTQWEQVAFSSAGFASVDVQQRSLTLSASFSLSNVSLIPLVGVPLTY